jgi:hypothetical protein
LTVLAGYRHIDLNERIFGSTSLAGTTTDLFSTEGFNRMDGFQLGGEAVFWRPSCRFRVEGDAKVGVLGDATSNYGSFHVPGFIPIMATSTGTHVAFMAEWGITAVVQINQNLGRPGWLPRVAIRRRGVGLGADGGVESRGRHGHDREQRHANLPRPGRQSGILLVGVCRKGDSP